ncbi:MAG: HlyC/CorC family transporter, partial [Candidatus Tectomicrobia bacterium]|nr:HlyC/CorC family transporter [Candidatus Tectomicrobia bacterium]
MDESVLSILLKLLTLTALVLMNAFYVTAEFALVSVRRTKIQQLADEGSVLAHSVLKAISNLDQSIAATQLGITIASLGLGWIGEQTLAHMLQPVLEFLPVYLVGLAAHSIAVTLAFLMITFLHVVLGELIPKSIALGSPDKAALWVAKPMELSVYLFRPFIWVLNGTGNTILNFLGVQPAGTHHLVHSAEELKMLVTASHKGGALDQMERDLLQKVFKFSDLVARQAMVPRIDMICIPSDLPLDELLSFTVKSSHTRFPVYEGNIDTIIGILHIKDLFSHSHQKEREEFDLKKIIRPVPIVPETT